jgi:hypothetical protein
VLWAVWKKGGIELLERVKDAIADKTDPWQRMQIACIVHTTGLLDWRRANQALFVMPPWHYPESIKARVIALGDEYEEIFVSLIDALPRAKEATAAIFDSPSQAHSLGLFSGSKRSEILPQPAIAKQMLFLLRAGVEDANSNPDRKS